MLTLVANLNLKVVLSQKEILHLKKMLAKRLRKFIPKWKIGRKWLMHDANKGMGCFLGYMYMRKIGHLVLWKIWRVQMRDLSP
jgi:hypothetical protein